MHSDIGAIVELIVEFCQGGPTFEFRNTFQTGCRLLVITPSSKDYLALFRMTCQGKQQEDVSGKNNASSEVHGAVLNILAAFFHPGPRVHDTSVKKSVTEADISNMCCHTVK